MRILFLYREEASFVRADLKILERHADVTAIRCHAGIPMSSVANAMRKHDLAFSWFGLGYALRAAVVGLFLIRPTIIVGGGWDVVDMPEIGYGVTRSTYGQVRAAYAFGLATKVCAFSDWSAREIRKVAPRAQVETVYLGVDTNRWRPGRSKERIVLTVGSVTWENLKRKGLETFAQTSKLVPDARFVLVGRQEPEVVSYLRSLGGSNLEPLGDVDEETLTVLAAQAKVYVQVSYTEGFGLALAEAMSSGCVPVVTELGAIPEVVGDTGFYVPFGSPERTAHAIRVALSSSNGMKARDRVAANFHIRSRESNLWRNIEAITHHEGG